MSTTATPSAAYTVWSSSCWARAAAAVGLDDADLPAGLPTDLPAGLSSGGPAGVGRGPDGHPDGRLFRLDGWLRERLPPAPAPDLAAVGRRLAAFGVTGVTDATAGTGPEEVELLAAAVTRGELPQRLTLTGGPALVAPEHPRIRPGPVKIVIDEGAPVEFDALVAQVCAAWMAGRPVAVHCVTRAALVLTLAVLDAAEEAAEEAAGKTKPPGTAGTGRVPGPGRGRHPTAGAVRTTASSTAR